MLASVFVVAGWAKLSDRPSSQRAVEAFGLPLGLARPVGILLPLAELAVAGALLVSSWARAGAAGALALLALFVVGISLNLARGRRPDCNCFGQVHSAPIGASTLVRNIVLAAVAVVVIVEGPGNFVSSWISRADATAWVAAAGALAIAVLAWFALNLTTQQGKLLERIDVLEDALGIAGPGSHPVAPPAGLPVGSPAPGFALSSVDGGIVALEDLLVGDHPALLLFTTADCRPCTALLPDVATWQTQYAGQLTITVIGGGDADANRAKARDNGIVGMLLQDDDEVGQAYGYLGTPGAVVVSANGVVISPVVAGDAAVRALVEDAAADRLPTQQWVPVPLNGHGHAHDHGEPVEPIGVAIGEPAPDVVLPDLDGTTVSLAGLRGRPTMVLFWRPSCGFCAGMLDDLRAWDSGRPAGSDPQLLVISSGTAEEHADMRLASPVVLDQSAEMMSAFGANGTPMAVLVDAAGLVASSVVVGANAVMDLARSAASTAGAR